MSPPAPPPSSEGKGGGVILGKKRYLKMIKSVGAEIQPG